ncbi:MAG: hypothetical protein OEU94_09460, partial [Aquincola sp.]|nr:hypothetical protein [Aquincola sp.]
HLPQPVVRAAAAAIRPLHEGVARVLDISMLDERQMRETWQPSKLLAEFPLRLTSVDAFIDERVAEWRRRRGTARRT